jgi:hypothetical protein
MRSEKEKLVELMAKSEDFSDFNMFIEIKGQS